MAGLEAPLELLGSSLERGRRGGRWRGGRGARLGGGGTAGRGHGGRAAGALGRQRGCPLFGLCVLLAVHA
jgi:hypothetical protein